MKFSFSISQFKSGRYEKRMLHPLREWFIGVSVFLLCVLSATAHSAYTFIKYESVNIDTVTISTESTIRYNRTLVETVLGRYQERAQEFSAIIAGIPVPEADTEEAGSMSTTTPEMEDRVTEEDENLDATTQEVMLSI